MEYTNNITHEEYSQDFFVANGVRNDSFVKESYIKIFILSLLFSVFYPIGYFYKQWKAIKKNNEEYKNISPFWRGVFYPFYAFSFAKIIANLFKAQKNDLLQNISDEKSKEKLEKKYKNNALFCQFLSCCFIVLFGLIISSSLAGKGWGIINYLFLWLSLFSFQIAINEVLPKNHPKGKIVFADFLGAFPSCIIIIFALIFQILIFPSFIKIEGQSLINKRSNYSFTFPFENQKIIDFEDSSFCQKENDDYNAEILCMGISTYTPGDTLEEVEITLKEHGFYPLKGWTETYNGNEVHCFNVIKEKLTEGTRIMCFFKQINEKDFMSYWTASTNKQDTTNLEKLMNSYKSW